MSTNLINTGILGLVFLLLFVLSEVLYRYFNLRAEWTRKMVHILTGFIAMSFPLLIGDHWIVMALCTVFFVVLKVAKRLEYLPSINGISRKSSGGILYPIAVYSCFAFQQYMGNVAYFYLPLLILAVCDPLAAVIGLKRGVRAFPFTRGKKTWVGSMVFFISAFLISGLYLGWASSLELTTVLIVSLIIAVGATLAEVFVQNGYDNISIPLSVVSVLFITQPLMF